MFDDGEKVALYKEYDFDSKSTLKKILIKERPADEEPADIAGLSDMVDAFSDEEQIRRVYAPDQDTIDELRNIAGGLR